MHPNLKKLLEREEGVVYTVYEDHLGLLTCGVGHLIIEGDAEFGQPVGTSVSADRVDALLEADLGVVDEDCRKLFGDFDELPMEIQLVCEAMVFQLGRSRLGGFVKFRASYETATKVRPFGLSFFPRVFNYFGCGLWVYAEVVQLLFGVMLFHLAFP